MSNLTKAVGSRLGIEIVTKSNPDPDLLRVARRLILQDDTLRAIFTQARKEDHSADRLTQELVSGFHSYLVEDSGGVAPEEVVELCQYLADEYLQLGEGILVTSPETGRPLALLTEKDLYQPAPVTREDGRVVTRPLALRPEVESLLRHSLHEDASEKLMAEQFSARIVMAGLEKQHSALAVSRAGRHTLFTQVQAALPTLLAEPRSGGFVSAFVKQFPACPFEGSGPEGEYNCVEFNCSSLTALSLVDWKAKSIRLDPLREILTKAEGWWVRDFAQRLYLLNALADPEVLPEVLLEKRLGEGLWVCSPNVGVYLRRLNPECQTILAGNSDRYVLWIQEKAGYLSFDPEKFKAEQRETATRWDVSTQASGRLWYAPSKVEAIGLRDIPTPEGFIERSFS